MKNNRPIDYKKIGEMIDKGNHILILPHTLPDGDTIGSSIALYHALKSISKTPYILIDEDIPSNLEFMGKDLIQRVLDQAITPDLVVSIDCSDIERLGSRRKYFDEVKNSLNIDHHVTNTHFCRHNFIDPEAAATGEIVFDIIKSLGISIDKEMATALYVALSTDTGSFKYDNTTPRTHKIAAELLGYHINQNRITTELYQSKPSSQVKLLAQGLNTLHMYYDGKLAVLSVTTDMLRESGIPPGDADGFIEFARDIKGVEVAVFLKEISDDEIKVSFRAKYDVDVSEIASQFHGGGHKKASGCTIYENIKKAETMIIKTIANYL